MPSRPRSVLAAGEWPATREGPAYRSRARRRLHDTTQVRELVPESTSHNEDTIQPTLLRLMMMLILILMLMLMMMVMTMMMLLMTMIDDDDDADGDDDEDNHDDATDDCVDDD